VSKHVRPHALDNPAIANLEEFEVEQTFLVRGTGINRGTQESVRRRGEGRAYTFVHKVRRPVGDGQFQETKRQVTNREYISLLANADPERRTVRIKRAAFLYGGKYYVMDTILNVNPTVRLIRTQVEDDDHDLELPQWINLEREVTGEPEWTMFHISTRITPERMKWPLTEHGSTTSSPGERAVDVPYSF
jgi:CYTH domain-containing protein